MLFRIGVLYVAIAGFGASLHADEISPQLVQIDDTSEELQVSVLSNDDQVRRFDVAGKFRELCGFGHFRKLEPTDLFDATLALSTTTQKSAGSSAATYDVESFPANEMNYEYIEVSGRKVVPSCAYAIGPSVVPDFSEWRLLYYRSSTHVLKLVDVDLKKLNKALEAAAPDS